MRLAGRDLSLVEFVNYIWSIVFLLVAVAGVWGSLKAWPSDFAEHRSLCTPEFEVVALRRSSILSGLHLGGTPAILSTA